MKRSGTRRQGESSIRSKRARTSSSPSPSPSPSSPQPEPTPSLLSMSHKIPLYPPSSSSPESSFEPLEPIEEMEAHDLSGYCTKTADWVESIAPRASLLGSPQAFGFFQHSQTGENLLLLKHANLRLQELETLFSFQFLKQAIGSTSTVDLTRSQLAQFPSKAFQHLPPAKPDSPFNRLILDSALPRGTRLPKSFPSSLAALKELSLVQCGVETLQGSVFDPPQDNKGDIVVPSQLQSLNLFGNELSLLPDSFFLTFGSIQELRLPPLVKLPASIYSAQSLRLLALNVCHLGWTTLPPPILALTNLEELRLFHGQIETLPEEMLTALPNLKTLDLPRQALKTIPIWLHRMPATFTHFNVDGNPFVPLSSKDSEDTTRQLEELQATLTSSQVLTLSTFSHPQPPPLVNIRKLPTFLPGDEVPPPFVPPAPLPSPPPLATADPTSIRATIRVLEYPDDSKLIASRHHHNNHVRQQGEGPLPLSRIALKAVIALVDGDLSVLTPAVIPSELIELLWTTSTVCDCPRCAPTGKRFHGAPVIGLMWLSPVLSKVQAADLVSPFLPLKPESSTALHDARRVTISYRLNPAHAQDWADSDLACVRPSSSSQTAGPCPHVRSRQDLPATLPTLAATN